uniref:Uncharacterized protein n=1 Tax=Triticum urartu TaxID=4572 RepID=A0A8R7R4J0_TRIUA
MARTAAAREKTGQIRKPPASACPTSGRSAPLHLRRPRALLLRPGLACPGIASPGLVHPGLACSGHGPASPTPASARLGLARPGHTRRASASPARSTWRVEVAGERGSVDVERREGVCCTWVGLEKRKVVGTEGNMP